MPLIELWVEGFRATGQSATARKLAVIEADDFDEAVRIYQLSNPGQVDTFDRTNFWTDEEYENRRSNYHIWACALFDNEADARKVFG